MTDFVLARRPLRFDPPDVDARRLDTLETHVLLRLVRRMTVLPFALGLGAAGVAAYAASDGDAVLAALVAGTLALLLAGVAAHDRRALRRGSRGYEELVRLARIHPEVRRYLRLRADHDARGCHLRVARQLARRDTRKEPAPGEFRRSELIDARGV